MRFVKSWTKCWDILKRSPTIRIFQADRPTLPMTIAGRLSFSMPLGFGLAPDKHIPEHTGKYKGVIRYHLALKVPEPADACGIRINNEVVHWQEGKNLLFDDTFPHEAWNKTDDYRVVLFLDIMRPLRFPLSFVNWLISKGIGLSPMIQGAKQKHQSWEQQFETLTQIF
jgi:ornithine lipid ester-linked acyl 2-hydroxylase